MNAFKELLDLFFTFFKIGAITFGGGLAMLPILERELADRKKWTTGEELLDYYAIAQTTPGIIAVNVATFVGYKRRKTLGGIFATVGVITPSLIIITFIAKFISNFEQIVWVQKALKGINVAVAALLTYSAYSFAKKTIKVWWNAIFYGVSFVAIYFFKLSPVLIVIIAAFAGVIIYFAGKKNISASKNVKKNNFAGEQKNQSGEQNNISDDQNVSSDKQKITSGAQNDSSGEQQNQTCEQKKSSVNQNELPDEKKVFSGTPKKISEENDNSSGEQKNQYNVPDSNDKIEAGVNATENKGDAR